MAGWSVGLGAEIPEGHKCIFKGLQPLLTVLQTLMVMETYTHAHTCMRALTHKHTHTHTQKIKLSL